jgi:hypothetical protein
MPADASSTETGSRWIRQLPFMLVFGALGAALQARRSEPGVTPIIRFGDRADAANYGREASLSRVTGTRVNADGKIGSEQRASGRSRGVREWLPPVLGLDRYGGLLERPNFAATGFSYRERRDGRWWFVTLDGHGFFALGIDVVSPDVGAIFVERREFMFAGLPELGHLSGCITAMRTNTRAFSRSGADNTTTIERRVSGPHLFGGGQRHV